MLILQELNSMLPPAEIPACTEGYEGFYHLNEMSGSVEKTQAHYIIRDHDRERFEMRKQRMEKYAAILTINTARARLWRIYETPITI